MQIDVLAANATSVLSALLSRTCQRQAPVQTVSGETWPAGASFACLYEESSPAQQGTLDYSAGAGYGYDVWMAPTQTLNAGDHVVVDNMTLKVLEAATPGGPGPMRRVRTQRIA